MMTRTMSMLGRVKSGASFGAEADVDNDEDDGDRNNNHEKQEESDDTTAR